MEQGDLKTEETRENHLCSTRDIPKVLIIFPENLHEDLFAIGGKRR